MHSTTNFTWIDVLVVIFYLLLLVGIGVFFSRRQKNIESFFLAGRGMGWLPIGLSLMAALNSGIDYVAAPSTVIKYGVIFTASVLSWVFVYPWVAWVTLPFYRRLASYSAYEYLEHRFSVSVRTLGAVIFLLWRIGWMGTALYVPCLAINAVTGGKLPLIPLIIVLGACVTLYTMLGGIEAVIWTDVLQFCIMFAGLAVTIAYIVSSVTGGLGEVWALGHAAGKTALSYSLDVSEGAGLLEWIRAYFIEPRALSAIVIAAVVGRLAGYTSDQVMVQRLQTTKTLKDARQAFIINCVGDGLWTIGLSLVGLAVFAYYQQHALPAVIAKNPDQIFPYFMANVLPTGIIGLVVAAILAASLSSIDSAINSCTSVVIVDFYNRLVLGRTVRPKDLSAVEQRAQIRVSRAATVAFGVIAIMIAVNVSRIGIVLEIGSKVIQTFTGPILGIYLLGMFTRRASSAGALVGGMAGTLMALAVAFLPFGITFLWPTVFGLATTVLLGYAVSLVIPNRVPEAVQLTWWQVVWAKQQQSSPAIQTLS